MAANFWPLVRQCASWIAIGFLLVDAVAASEAAGGVTNWSGTATRQSPLLIGIAGGSGCGKTSFARNIARAVGADAALVSTDNYYKTLSEQDHQLALQGAIDFDRVEALDIDLLHEDLGKMKANETEWPVMLPSYDFVSHRRTDRSVPLTRPRVVIIEGLFVLAIPGVRELLDIRLFAQEDIDTCLVRRLRRDVSERGIRVAAALDQYQEHVKPAYDAIVHPSSVFADVIVPNASRNFRATELVASWVLQGTPRQDASCAASAKSGCG